MCIYVYIYIYMYRHLRGLHPGQRKAGQGAPGSFAVTITMCIYIYIYTIVIIEQQ